MARATFRITVPRRGSSRSRNRRLLLAAVLALGGWSNGQAFEPAINYMLQCMGCHTPDGRGEPGHVPSVRETLVPLATTPAGRKFLIQVPGSAQSKLTDAELAAVLNWMVDNLSARPAARPVERFTAAEVATHRHTPLVAVQAERKRLIAGTP